MSGLSKKNSCEVWRGLRRYAKFLIASALLHLFMVTWVTDQVGDFFLQSDAPRVVVVELAPTHIENSASIPPSYAHSVRASRTFAASLKPVVLKDPSVSKHDVSINESEHNMVTAVVEEEKSVISSAASMGSASVESIAESPLETIKTSLPHYSVSPPPSVELKYDVGAYLQGTKYSGSGVIRWEMEQSHYVLTLEAKVFFIRVLSAISEGTFDEYGVAPLRYSEIPRGRAKVNTYFNRDLKTISFSASTASIPRQGGEQDRNSVSWQLAGIGRAHSELFAPDFEISMMVAGTRDVDLWRFVVLAEESLKTGAGIMRTWHLARIPKLDSYDKRVDIWLAPDKEWYPVRILHTEKNGNTTDLLLTEIISLNR